MVGVVGLSPLVLVRHVDVVPAGLLLVLGPGVHVVQGCWQLDAQERHSERVLQAGCLAVVGADHARPAVVPGQQ